MAIRVSGSLLASLCYEQSHGGGDQEGFLIGRVVKKVTDVISDSQLNHTKEESLVYVFNYVPCQGLFSWYDSGGKVVTESLKSILSGGQRQDVIGWYKIRRHSTLNVSLRERMVHKHLLDAFPGIVSKHFLFALFTSSCTSNQSTHSFDHVIKSLDGRHFKSLPLLVVNLEDTSHADYRCQPCSAVQSTSGLFSQTVSKQWGDFLDSGEQLREVVSMRTLHSQVQMQLTELSGKVCRSEERLGSIRREVANLRERHRKKNPLIPIDVSKLELRSQYSTQHDKARHSKPFPLPSFARQSAEAKKPPEETKVPPRSDTELHEDLMLLAQQVVVPASSLDTSSAFSLNESSEAKSPIPNVMDTPMDTGPQVEAVMLHSYPSELNTEAKAASMNQSKEVTRPGKVLPSSLPLTQEIKQADVDGDSAKDLPPKGTPKDAFDFVADLMVEAKTPTGSVPPPFKYEKGNVTKSKESSAEIAEDRVPSGKGDQSTRLKGTRAKHTDGKQSTGSALTSSSGQNRKPTIASTISASSGQLRKTQSSQSQPAPGKCVDKNEEAPMDVSLSSSPTF